MQPPRTPRPQRPIQTRKDLEARIIANAWRDPAYKESLMKDPKAVMAGELHAIDPSIQLPAELNVSVHEEDANHFHLVLPRNPKDIALSEILNEDGMEVVAPQTIGIVVVVGATVAATVTAGANANTAANANLGANANAVAGVNFTAVANTVS
jgi:hypothetical protein